MPSRTEPLLRAQAQVREHLLDEATLVRAVASGRQRGQVPGWRRVEIRYVDLNAGRHLQVTGYDDTQAHTRNHPVGEASHEAVDALLAEPFGSWHVETTEATHQLRVTKRREAVVHSTVRSVAVAAGPARGHDRAKPRLLAEDSPVLRALGLADVEGRVKPSRQAKLRQVEEFLRLLDAALGEAVAAGQLRQPTAEDPLRIVDLGCGNSYLTFAAHAYLTGSRGLPVRLVGVDVKEQSRDHHEAVAAHLAVDSPFVLGSIGEAVVDPVPEVVLALHACDTATDQALARAVGWGSPLVLAAPCCHHDVAAQLRAAPAPYPALTRHGILRERFADTLTDALRAALLRLRGYRVDVVEFVESAHTPRNTLLRGVRTGTPIRGGAARREYDDLVTTWQVRPRLAELLGVDA